MIGAAHERRLGRWWTKRNGASGHLDRADPRLARSAGRLVSGPRGRAPTVARPVPISASRRRRRPAVTRRATTARGSHEDYWGVRHVAPASPPRAPSRTRRGSGHVGHRELHDQSSRRYPGFPGPNPATAHRAPGPGPGRGGRRREWTRRPRRRDRWPWGQARRYRRGMDLIYPPEAEAVPRRDPRAGWRSNLPDGWGTPGLHHDRRRARRPSTRTGRASSSRAAGSAPRGRRSTAARASS